MRKTVFFWLIIFFVFLNIVDMLTTIFILPGESNPIYLLTKSFSFILIVKLVVVSGVVLLYMYNKYTSNTIYYMFVTVIVYGSLALLLAQVININAILHPQIMADAVKATVQQKQASYNSFVTTIYLIPVLFSTLCFIIYNTSVRYIQIVEKKKINWGKIFRWK